MERRLRTIGQTQLNTLVTGLIYLVPLFGLYYSSHRVMVKWWERGDYNYCYLVPLIVLYLIWEKRRALNTLPSTSTWVGFAPLVSGIMLFWLGELGGEFYTLYISSWLVLLGLLWIHMGWRKLKVIIFPVCFILTMFPPPNFVYFNLSLKLKLMSSRLGVWVLQGIGKTAYREGNVIDLGFTQLQVVDACNGLRYLFPLIVLSLLVSYLFKSAWWKKAIIVISAIPISIFVNGLRIASVGLLYPIWGPRVAEGFFHDLAGWAIFMISFAILMGEMWLLNRLFREKEIAKLVKEDMDAAGEKVEDEYKAPSRLDTLMQLCHSPHFILAFLLITVSAAISHAVNFQEVTPIKRPLVEFPLHIGQWYGRSEAMEQKFIDGLKFSDYITANYQNSSGQNINFYTVYYDSQRKGESIHTPQSCLPGGGWIFQESGLTDVPVNGTVGTPLKVNRAFIKKGGQKQLIYFWFPMRGRVAHNLWEMKALNFWDALTRKRTDGALVRIITPVYNGEELDIAERRLQAFIIDVLPVLNDFLPQ
jgi:exosortase D (VPLPA-CTERM-specific)